MDTLLRWWRSRPPIVQDGCLAVVLAVLALTVLRGDGGAGLLGVVGAVAVAFRRSAPTAVLVVTGACLLVGAAVAGAGWGALPPALVAVATVGASSPRAGAGAAIVEAAWTCAWLPRTFDDAIAVRAVAVVALFTLAIAVALVARGRRAVHDVARERVRRLHLADELDAARHLADQRLALARRLHDALGHHVAVANVQAAVAAELLTSHPEHARAALAHVQAATTTVLDELGALSGPLHPAEAPQDPSAEPGLDAVDALVDAQRAAGLDLEAVRVGDPRPLPPAVDLAAYRVAEESLVNARRHGEGDARLSVLYAQDVVVVETVNALRAPDAPGVADEATAASAPATSAPAAGAPVASAPLASAPTGGAGSGAGIVGMRERVSALGGRLDVGPVSGRFVVRATLPAPGPAPSDGPDAPPDGAEPAASTVAVD